MFKYYLLFVTFAVGLQAADASWYGTWKMDASRSHAENVPLLVKSVTLVIQKQEENDVLDFSGVDAEGKPMKAHLTQPHTGGKLSGLKPTAQYDDAIVAVPDDHHCIYTYRKNGKTVLER